MFYELSKEHSGQGVCMGLVWQCLKGNELLVVILN